MPGTRHAMLLLLALAGVASRAAEPELLSFDAAAPLADRAAIAARMLHGYQHRRAQAAAAADGRVLAGPALDPRGERWEVIAPDDCSAAAPCGALVWVHPFEGAARAPREWRRVLERARVVLVAADRSGNDQPVLDRRVPLALLGLAGVQARHAIDPARTWIGGFSGGGRVASRMAAAFPDLFAGGIFVATADGPGTADSPLPPEPLLSRLRAGRYWFAVGTEDPENASIVHDAAKHFRRACALDAEVAVQTGWGHRTLDARRLAAAIRFLDAGRRAAPADRARCEAAAAAPADAAMAQVRGLLAAGERPAARAALLEAHRAWGGIIAAAFDELLPEVEPPPR